jgi:hypothetical protein
MAIAPPSASADSTSPESARRGADSTPRHLRLRGGPEGNEQLTAYTGVVLILLLAVLGVTIIRIGQLTWLHMFLGLLLIGPVGLKMASTGYRFLRYYTRSPPYLRKGPPEAWLRLLAPAVVLTTVAVFASGVLLVIDGPAGRGPVVLIHKVSFIAWGLVTALHVLGHLPGMSAALRLNRGDRTSAPLGGSGGAGRAIALAGALVGGLVLALVLIPDFAAWTSNTSIFHHHHHG